MAKKSSTDLRLERKKLLEEGRTLIDKAETEGRGGLAPAEREQFDKLWEGAEKLKAEIFDAERVEKLSAAEADLKESQGRQTDPEGRGGKPDGDERRNGRPNDWRAERQQYTPAEIEQRHKALKRYLRGGMQALTEEERRTMVVDSDQDGGYLVLPEQMLSGYLRHLNQVVNLRRLCRVIPAQGFKATGIAKRTTKASTFAWSAEIQAPTADTSLKFGKRVLQPHHLTGEISVSRDLLSNPAMDAEAIVYDEMAEDAGVVQEQAFLTGDGARKPLGLFVPHADGISTGRDVTEGSSTTAFTGDSLMAVKYKVRQRYWQNARWLMHPDAVKMAAMLKDGEGRYLLRESLRADEGDLILGKPVEVSEYSPNTFTTGSYLALFGDFQHYLIADALELEIQRLMEIAARQNQVAFIGRMKIDAGVGLEEAFARLKLS